MTKTDIDAVKSVIDYVIVPGSVVATLIGWLPPIAAGLSIIWVGLQIYDRVKYGPKR